MAERIDEPFHSDVAERSRARVVTERLTFWEMIIYSRLLVKHCSSNMVKLLKTVKKHSSFCWSYESLRVKNIKFHFSRKDLCVSISISSLIPKLCALGLFLFIAGKKGCKNNPVITKQVFGNKIYILHIKLDWKFGRASCIRMNHMSSSCAPHTQSSCARTIISAPFSFQQR